MIIESKKKFDKIKCGKCKSEYFPQTKTEKKEKDFSCPVCGHGKFFEAKKTTKEILFD